MLKNVMPLLNLTLGPLLGWITFLLLPESYLQSSDQVVTFTDAGRATAGVAVWMAFWWMTEVIPVYMTALLPILIFPLLEAVPIKQASAPYAHYLIFLFMGGFILSLSMQRWGLHKRIALRTLMLVGSSPSRIIAGFMIATAGLSMWVSNTATTIMMTPIAISLLALLSQAEGQSEKNKHHFSLCLLLAIAYSASIGGIGTLIGTPPNLLLASFIKENLGQEISFVQWLGVGLPVVLIFIPLCWFMLTRVLFRFKGLHLGEADNVAKAAYAALGPMNKGEKYTLAVFLLAVFAWIFRPLLQQITLGDVQPLAKLSDTGIALAAALLLFILPVDLKKREYVMDWETCKELPWGILLLFGGGLSLAAAIDQNGVGAFVGYQFSDLHGISAVLMIGLVALTLIFMTELTSNMATTATMVPILAAVAPVMGLHPFMLIIPATIAASCAFMMPVATAPNAIVFSSGRIRILDMCRAGFLLNLLGVLLITVLMYAVALPLLGVPLSVLQTVP